MDRTINLYGVSRKRSELDRQMGPAEREEECRADMIDLLVAERAKRERRKKY